MNIFLAHSVDVVCVPENLSSNKDTVAPVRTSQPTMNQQTIVQVFKRNSEIGGEFNNITIIVG